MKINIPKSSLVMHKWSPDVQEKLIVGFVLHPHAQETEYLQLAICSTYRSCPPGTNATTLQETF